MFLFPPTIILRHRRENLKKCSLSGLESRSDMQFYAYPLKVSLPNLTNYVILSLEGPELNLSDREYGIVLVDGSWRHAVKMLQFINRLVDVPKRSLPKEWKTAYPRRQEDCQDPTRGLASIEALYAAYTITGRDASRLLDHYYWRDSFLKQNPLKTSVTEDSNFLPIA